MIIDERKSIDELQEIRYNYHKDITQLEEIHFRLRERYSKLSEINDNSHVGVALELTVDGIKNIEEALHKLYDAGAGVEKLLQLYEYVEIINLKTGEREVIYSTKGSIETLENIHFHPSRNSLLITLGHICLEYDCLTKLSTTVAEAGENELFIDGYYTEGKKPQIQIAVVEHFNYDEPHIEPHCDFYSIHQLKTRTSYKREWRYYMPTLTEETAKDFMYASQDIGAGAAYTKQEFQTYWCTRGFFMHEYPSDEAFKNIRCTTFKNGREVKLDKAFGTLQMIYCRHDFFL